MAVLFVPIDTRSCFLPIYNTRLKCIRGKETKYWLTCLKFDCETVFFRIFFVICLAVLIEKCIFAVRNIIEKCSFWILKLIEKCSF